jgi:hypothetical protein
MLGILKPCPQCQEPIGLFAEDCSHCRCPIVFDALRDGVFVAVIFLIIVAILAMGVTPSGWMR